MSTESESMNTWWIEHEDKVTAITRSVVDRESARERVRKQICEVVDESLAPFADEAVREAEVKRIGVSIANNVPLIVIRYTKSRGRVFFEHRFEISYEVPPSLLNPLMLTWPAYNEASGIRARILTAPNAA